MKKRNFVKPLIVCVTFLILLVYLAPLYWLFVNSIKGQAEIFANPPSIWPRNPIFTNYLQVFQSSSSNVVRSFGNSVVIASLTTIITMIFSLPAAYALAKFRLKGTGLVLFLLMVGQMLSPTIKLVPLFISFRSMSLINSPFSVAIALATFTVPFAILIMRPYFLSVPTAISESALIDGCGIFSSFARVILPISYPGIIVAAIFNFLAGWNDLIYPITFLTDQNNRPMVSNIYNFIGEYGSRWNMLLAFAVVSVIPVIIMFITMQKFIIGGITMGSVKG